MKVGKTQEGGVELLESESKWGNSEDDGSSGSASSSATAVEPTTSGLTLVGDWFESDEDGMGSPAGIMLSGLMIGGWRGWSAGSLCKDQLSFEIFPPFFEGQQDT